MGRNQPYPRESNDTPSVNAFCCVAPGVRLSDFAIFATAGDDARKSFYAPLVPLNGCHAFANFTDPADKRLIVD